MQTRLLTNSGSKSGRVVYHVGICCSLGVENKYVVTSQTIGIYSCRNALYNRFTLRRHLKKTWHQIIRLPILQPPLAPGLQFLCDKKEWSSLQATKITRCVGVAAVPWETSVEKYQRSAVDFSISRYHYYVGFALSLHPAAPASASAARRVLPGHQSPVQWHTQSQHRY